MCVTDRRKRHCRSRVQIATDIIEIAKNGSPKSRIMYLGNLSFDLLPRYIQMLMSFGLIQTRDGDSSTYVATEKGSQLLKGYSELRKCSEMAESKKRAPERSLSLMPEET